VEALVKYRLVVRWQVGRQMIWALVGVAIALGGWAAFAPLPSGSREFIYVIPKGAWTRRSAGETLEALPSHVYLTVGVQDVLVLQNEDEVPQFIGPVLLGPGQTYRIPFRTPSVVQFACALHTGGLTIVVEPTPQLGWGRFRWRLAQLIDNHRPL
jgi:hypothetical protein